MKLMFNMEFYDQFAISLNNFLNQEKWKNYHLGNYWLESSPSLPVHSLLDDSGNRVGFALGWLINSSGKLIKTQIQLPLSITTNNMERIEKLIYSFSGRYIFIIITSEVKRIYLDPGGTLALTYCSAKKRAGSTISLLLSDEPDHPVWLQSTGEFPDDRSDQFYPAGLTPSSGINRVMPNHYLDLENWKSVRHYPKSIPGVISIKNIPAHIEKVISILQLNICAVMENFPLIYMPLTAGQDSRMLLACSKNYQDKIRYVTFDHSNQQLKRHRKRWALIDLHISQILAKKFSLQHLLIPVPANSPQSMRLRYLRQIGFSGGSNKVSAFFESAQEHLELSGAWMTGFGAEVGRAFYWRDSDQNIDHLSSTILLNRMGLPFSIEFQNAVDNWLYSLPKLPITMVLDFLYLENRLGCWASPHLYGTAPFSISLLPFNNHEIFETMLRLPPEYKQSQRLTHDIISNTWPDLLSFPYNNYTGMRGLIDQYLKSFKHRFVK